MTRTTRHTITALLAMAGVFSFVGVSAALEGEEPILGEVECTEESTDPACDVPVDDGTVDDGTVDDVPVDDGTVDDGILDDGTVDDGILDDGTTEDDPVVEPEVGPVDNHGAAVSAAAHECPKGPEHGPCVRDVARSDAGKPAPDSTEGETETETETEAAKGGRPEGKGKPAR